MSTSDAMYWEGRARALETQRDRLAQRIWALEAELAAAKNLLRSAGVLSPDDQDHRDGRP